MCFGRNTANTAHRRSKQRGLICFMSSVEQHNALHGINIRAITCLYIIVEQVTIIDVGIEKRFCSARQIMFAF